MDKPELKVTRSRWRVLRYVAILFVAYWFIAPYLIWHAKFIQLNGHMWWGSQR